MKHLAFACFNLVGACVITTLLILSVEGTPYPKGVGLALALLIGGAMASGSVGIPMYLWWIGRREGLRGGGDEES